MSDPKGPFVAAVKKLLRTAQSHFPALVEAKNSLYHLARAHLGFVHDREYEVVARLPLGPEAVFLDIGANRGQSILAIRHYRPGAIIHSFEPNPRIFAGLARRFGRMEGVTLHDCGLGEAHGHFTLYVPSYRGFVYDGAATFSARHARAYLGPETLFFFDPARLTVEEIRCRVAPLDSFGLAPAFIKVDAEGGEYAVLQGGIETLRRHRPALFLERYYEDTRIESLLDGLGYREVIWREGRFVEGSEVSWNRLLLPKSPDIS
jgi:FkbM family methyltransferase